MLTCGTYGNVLRFLPPLVMPDHLLDEGLDILESVFASAWGPWFRHARSSLLNRRREWPLVEQARQGASAAG